MPFLTPIKFYAFLLCLTFALIMPYGRIVADADFTVNKEFSLFTSANLKGYTKPLITTLGESFNTSQYTKAVYEDYWTIGLDISAMGVFIPSSQKNYDAELPEGYEYVSITNVAQNRDGIITQHVYGTTKEPTIYGGKSYAVFSAPQTSAGDNYRSVAFIEGHNISSMPGLPVLQIFVGMPTRTQLKLKFFTVDIGDYPVTYFGVMLNQQIDHFVDLFHDPRMGLALNASFNMMSVGNGFDMNTFTFGCHYSYEVAKKLYLYTGLQYETLSGNFKATREDYVSSDFIRSPYEEVRNGEDLEFDLESFTNYRFLGGIAYRTGIMEVHADMAYASQPIFGMGFSLYFAEIGKNKLETTKENK